MSSVLKVDEIQNTDGKTGLVITPDGSIDGIKFPKEVNPSGRTITSTTMSSYEAGTWTPTSTGAGTIVVNAGSYYTKVGRNVTLHINSASFSDITSTSYLGIGGLPFEAGDSSAVGDTMMSRRNDTIAIVSFIAANTSELRFYPSSTTGGFVRLTHNIFKETTNALYLSITYQTA
jgi:hypothetical protein